MMEIDTDTLLVALAVPYDGNRYDTVVAVNTVQWRSYDTVIAAVQYRTTVSIVDRLVFVVSNLFVDLG